MRLRIQPELVRTEKIVGMFTLLERNCLLEQGACAPTKPACAGAVYQKRLSRRMWPEVSSFKQLFLV